MMQQHKEREPWDAEPQSESDKISLFEMYTLLPRTMQMRCNKQFIGALLILVVALICTIYNGNVMYIIAGICFAAFIAGMGIRLLWRCRSGKIVYKQMVCVKVHAIPLMKTKKLILRESDVPIGDERGIHSYIVSNTKNLTLLSPGTFLNIYVDLDAPHELLAWQIIG